MSTDNVETIRGMYQAFARGDLEAVLRPCAPGVKWLEAENFIYADGNPYIGRDAVLQGVFLRLGMECANFSVAPQRFLDAGETVVAHGYYSGTHNRTRRRVKAQFAHLFTFRDGQVVHFQQFTDTAQFLQAIQDTGGVTC